MVANTLLLLYSTLQMLESTRRAEGQCTKMFKHTYNCSFFYQMNLPKSDILFVCGTSWAESGLLYVLDPLTARSPCHYFLSILEFWVFSTIFVCSSFPCCIFHNIKLIKKIRRVRIPYNYHCMGMDSKTQVPETHQLGSPEI